MNQSGFKAEKEFNSESKAVMQLVQYEFYRNTKSFLFLLQSYINLGTTSVKVHCHTIFLRIEVFVLTSNIYH
jgi:hypothetical protein